MRLGTAARMRLGQDETGSGQDETDVVSSLPLPVSSWPSLIPAVRRQSHPDRRPQSHPGRVPSLILARFLERFLVRLRERFLVRLRERFLVVLLERFLTMYTVSINPGRPQSILAAVPSLILAAQSHPCEVSGDSW